MRHHRTMAICSAILVVLCTFSPLLAQLAAAQATQPEVYFTIMHTNDEHSALLPSPLVDYSASGNNASSGGFARLAQAVLDTRSRLGSEPSLLISGGDYLSGSPFSWLALTGEAAELRLMQQLGYDVITIGNHEYDYGPEVLAKYLRAAGYPDAAARTAIVASNTMIPAGHPLGEVGIQKTYIKQLQGGVSIGFFGLMGIEASEVAPSAPPVEFSEQQAAARAAVQTLQAAGVDLIVAISHCGEEEDQVIAKAVPGIDIIIGGHSHSSLPQPITVNQTLIVQTGTKLANLGLLRVAYNLDADTVRLRNAEVNEPYLLPLDEKIPFNPEFTAQVERYAADLNGLLGDMTGGRFSSISETVLHSDFTVSNQPELSESPFGNFVADAMRFVGEEVTEDKVDFAIQANGVIRGSIEPSKLAATEGQVALLDLVNLVGLGAGPGERPGYPLVSFYFTGEEMRRVLEVGTLLSQLKGDIYFLQYSGLKLKFDPDRAILATIPVKNLPIPTGRSVLTAERYTGTGVQNSALSSDYTPLLRGDEQLYHVVSDYYLAKFLPMVGEMLPSWALVMKDKNGVPLSSVEEAIVYRDGREMKVWQTVLEYAAGLPQGETGLPEMPAYYQITSNRLQQVDTLPIWLWPLAGLVLLLATLTWGIWTWRRKRRAAHA